MSARTRLLKDSLLQVEPELCPERAVLLTAEWRETEGQPLILRRARAFARVLREMPVYIRPGELLVGNQASQPRAAPFFPEYAVGWLEREIDELAVRPYDRFQVSPAARTALLDAAAYWRGRTYYDLVRSTMQAALPDDALAAFDLDTFCCNQVIANLGRVSNGDGHIIVGYQNVIRLGMNGIIAEARRRLAELDLTREENVEKRLFYQAVIISLEAAIGFAARFADLAERQLREEADPARRAELGEIAAVCRRVPAAPARTFREALQTYWFTHLLLHVEADGHSIGPGRLDQHLYPYYAADLAAGRLNRDEALELIECFWLKCCELNKVREWGYTRFMSGYPLFQTITLGGQTRDGADATTELSYLCLEATANLQLPQPTAVVRVHDGTPDDFLLAAARCLLRHGGGMPGFFSDEVAIPLLMNVGVSLQDARNWAVMGCSEPQVGGRFNTGTGGVTHVNLLKVLELALYGGVNPNTGHCPCPGEGDLATLRSFDDLLAAFRRQLAYYVRLAPTMDAVTCYAYAQRTPTPFLSSVVDHRLEIGKDISLGGGPNYHNMMCFGEGVTNVANSLAAVKKLVWEDEALTAAELLEALHGDFAGPRGEQIRQMLLNRAPKYGNDEDYVDLLARQVLNAFVDEVTQYKPPRGGCYGPTTQSLTANVPYGQRVGATPDGRRAGEPLADNSSPTPGSDVNGPTAVLKSVAKLDHVRVGNGTILNLKLHPSALKGEAQLRKFAALVRTLVDLKGFQVQFNVVSAEVLREAQAHPEAYRNLVVKVAGYSALFATLDRQLQDQLIERTTHYLG